MFFVSSLWYGWFSFITGPRRFAAPLRDLPKERWSDKRNLLFIAPYAGMFAFSHPLSPHGFSLSGFTPSCSLNIQHGDSRLLGGLPHPIHQFNF